MRNFLKLFLLFVVLSPTVASAEFLSGLTTQSVENLVKFTFRGVAAPYPIMTGLSSLSCRCARWSGVVKPTQYSTFCANAPTEVATGTGEVFLKLSATESSLDYWGFKCTALSGAGTPIMVDVWGKN